MKPISGLTQPADRRPDIAPDNTRQDGSQRVPNLREPKTMISRRINGRTRYDRNEQNHVNVRRTAMMKSAPDRHQDSVPDLCLENRMLQDEELDAVVGGTYVCVQVRWFTIDDKGTILPVHSPC
jgi:hypothetical protein